MKNSERNNPRPTNSSPGQFTETELKAGRYVTVAGNSLTIFVDSASCIKSMIADIGASTHRVWLESYIILDDAIGRAVAAALIEKARAGIEVRVLYDAIGCLTTSAGYFQRLSAAGVEVHEFHSFWEALWRFSVFRILNRRNHRKVLVIDDSIAYFGGMNIGEPSQAESIERKQQLPSSAGWRDVHVRLAGPQQADVAESFERSWKRARRQRVERRPAAYRAAQLSTKDESIQFFDSGPGKRYTLSARIFTRLIMAARRRLLFSMAYFIPVGGVLRQLLKAHRRGVFVQVVVPGVSDVLLAQHATRYLYRTLLRRRFHLYERQMNMLHSKVLVVDDQWTVLGSANLDARSLWINLEFLAVIRSHALAKVMGEVVQHEIAQSRRVRLKTHLKSSWRHRLWDRLSWSLRWWL